MSGHCAGGGGTSFEEGKHVLRAPRSDAECVWGGTDLHYTHVVNGTIVRKHQTRHHIGIECVQ